MGSKRTGRRGRGFDDEGDGFGLEPVVHGHWTRNAQVGAGADTGARTGAGAGLGADGADAAPGPTRAGAGPELRTTDAGEPTASPGSPPACSGKPSDGPRTLFIDADACPVTSEALEEARRAGVSAVIAGNTTQNLERHIRPSYPREPEAAKRGFWVDTLAASVGADSADFAIVERLRPGDVVVTQDIGLASICLGRGAKAIGVRGHVYDPLAIDAQLLVRHEEKRLRRAGGRTGGPSAFTDEDRHRFIANLRRLLAE